jgi:hypothetical protein
MSRRVLVVLVVLGVLATGGGVAGGLLLARGPGGDPVVAGPTTLPETTTPPTSEPASSTSSTSSSSTSTTSGLTLQARVAERLEDGVVVRYDASEPVTAVLSWGFGGPSGHQLQFPGPAAEGSLKLVLARSNRAVSMRVTGQSADGRAGTSDTLTARRLVRRVVLEVKSLSLDIPGGTGETGGIATGFRGTTYTPLGPETAGPTVSSEPYAFPSVALGAGERSSPLALRFFHRVPPEPRRTQVVNLAVPFPRSGGSSVTRDVTAIGVTAHLRLRVTVTVS